MSALDLMRQLVMCRLLVLQSKRLRLASTERRMRETRNESLRNTCERLAADIGVAQRLYIETLLRWGTPDMEDYLPMIYSRLVEMASVLGDQLQAAIGDLPVTERYEVAADVEMLDHMIRRWKDEKRRAMIESVA